VPACSLTGKREIIPGVGRLKRFARDWNLLGERNPYGAILTGAAGELPRWTVEEFFETGRVDAARFIADLAGIAPTVQRRAVLDFGCGVGRVTRALAGYFQSAVGVDVASTMISRARLLNRSYPNCRFVVTPQGRLRGLDAGQFDAVYSRLVLQHIPPALVRRCIPECIRVLAPGGILMFQMPGEIAPEPEGAFLDAPVADNGLKPYLPRAVVRAYRLVKYRFIVDESIPKMAMFGMARDSVLKLVSDAGGRVLTTRPDQSHGPDVPGFEYWVTR
jgi:SAM-dependent methyltransferase